MNEPDITLRDYLAANVIFPTTLPGAQPDAEIMSEMLGIDLPSIENRRDWTCKEWRRWWCKAEAVWRYQVADAMLEARKALTA